MEAMNMAYQPKNWFINAGRVGIAALFIVVTMLQLFSFPGQFAYDEANDRLSSTMRWVMTFAMAIWMLTAQFALVGLWKFVTLTSRGELFTSEMHRWLTVIVRALGTSLGFCIAALATIIAIADDPGPGVMLSALTGLIGALFFAAYLVRYHNEQASLKITASTLS